MEADRVFLLYKIFCPIIELELKTKCTQLSSKMSTLPDGQLVPDPVADFGRDVDDLGAVGEGVDQFQPTLVQLQGDVLLAGVASVDAENDSLE